MGHNNVGKGNIGDYNVGDHNIGRANIGSYNRSHFNIGDCNISDRNIGCFNTTENKYLTFFNKESTWTENDWQISEANGLLQEWFTLYDSDNDVAYSYKEAWAIFWGELTSREEQAFLTLPNFDANIFKEITGIDVNAKATQEQVNDIHQQIKELEDQIAKLKKTIDFGLGLLK